MINIAIFKKNALSFAETNEQPHFEKISFRVGKKYLQLTTVKITGLVLNCQ